MRPRTNLVIAVLAAAILAAFAFRGFTHQPAHPAASRPGAKDCTPEAIRQVTDALERSVLSANCAKQARESAPRN